jgi:hypothetical protein
VVTATLAARNSPATLIEHRVQARLNQSQNDYSKHSTLVSDGFFKERGTFLSNDLQPFNTPPKQVGFFNRGPYVQ